MGEAEATHKGLKKMLPRKVWVGPGVSPDVTKTLQIPWDMHSMRCGKCRTDGYMTWQCKNPVACIKCRGKGYLAVKCPYCESCSNYGHETAKCPSSEANIGTGVEETNTRTKREWRCEGGGGIGETPQKQPMIMLRRHGHPRK